MTALPAYHKVLKIRPEILGEQDLIDMVDLAHVAEGQTEAPAGGSKRKRRGLKARLPAQEALQDPAAFFDLTFPTEDVKQTLYALARRGANPEDVPGTIMLAGRYGLGKSHVLLAAHHALTAPKVAARWAKRWQLEPLQLPEGARVITRNFINRTAENLWDVFFEGIGRPELGEQVTTYPDGEQIRSVLGDQPVFLILDELERWYDAVPERMQSRNRNFIQALSEVAMRDPRLTLLTSVLGERQEPAETIRRTRPMELTFRSPTDRQQIILFRLFANHGDHDMRVVDSVVSSYVESYRDAGIGELDAYAERMRASYPFTPEFLDILTKKVPNLGGFQNTRGTLRFLSSVVQATHDSRPLVSSQDLPFKQSDTALALSNLDTTGGEVVRRALGDNYEAVPGGMKHKDSLFSAILFYSIADPSHPGASRQDILRAVLDPDENVNAIKDSLLRIQGLAFNLHVQDERFLFKTSENPRARINAVARSPQVTDSACRQLVIDSLVERWGMPRNTVVFDGDVEAARKALRALGNVRPRFLISTVSLSPSRRLELQNLDERRNLVLLLEPLVRNDRKADAYSLLGDDELIGRARNIEACNRLLEGQPERASATVYREVRQQETSKLAAGIAERFGRYVDWHRTGSTRSEVDDSWYELGHVDEFDARAFLEHFKGEYSGQPFIDLRVKELWPQYRHRKVRNLVDHFDTTPSEPTPYEADMVATAVRKLVSKHELSLQNAQGKTYTEHDIGELSIADLPDCTLHDPVTVAPREEKDDDLTLTHVNVAAQYDDRTDSVKVVWTLPELPSSEPGGFRTLVQRYANIQGWEPGKAYPVDLDRTHDANRYLEGGDSFIDADKLTRGAWYYYYVFLVHDRPGKPPQAVLSKRCDVHVPEPIGPTTPDQVLILPQPSRSRLMIEAEQRVMSPDVMTSDSRARKVVFELHGVTDHDHLRAFARDLGVDPSTVEVRADITLTVRRDMDRQQFLNLINKLPRVDNAHYAARLHLQGDTEDPDTTG